jgi:hypothetical protein
MVVRIILKTLHAHTETSPQRGLRPSLSHINLHTHYVNFCVLSLSHTYVHIPAALYSIVCMCVHGQHFHQFTHYLFEIYYVQYNELVSKRS